MPLTLAERLEPCNDGSMRAIIRPWPDGECAWCRAMLAENEGVLLKAPGEIYRVRLCNETCAEEFEADRLSRSPKARRDAPQGRWELEPIPGDPGPAPNIPVTDLAPTRAEVAK